MAETGVISTTHHTVRIVGDKVIKTARDTSPAALRELHNDYRYLTIMGYKVTVDGNSLIMPFIGNPLESIADSIESLLDVLEQAQLTLPMPETKKRLGKSIHKTTKQKLVERLGQEDPYDVHTRTRESMRTARKILNQKTPTVISHTDSHSKNFLRDDAGTIHLIDWESAIAGLPEFDLAVLELYLLAEVTEGVITEDIMVQVTEQFIKPRVKDTEAYDAFFSVKLVRHALWQYSLDNTELGEYFVDKANAVMLPYLPEENPHVEEVAEQVA